MNFFSGNPGLPTAAPPVPPAPDKGLNVPIGIPENSPLIKEPQRAWAEEQGKVQKNLDFLNERSQQQTKNNDLQALTDARSAARRARAKRIDYM